MSLIASRFTRLVEGLDTAPLSEMVHFPAFLLATVDLPTLDRAEAGRSASTGGVGTQGHVQLFNPVKSGCVIIVDQIWITNGTSAGPLQLRVYDTALTTLAATVPLERGRVIPGTIGQIRTQILSAVGTLFAQIYPTAVDVNLEVKWERNELKLYPGRGILVATSDQEVTRASYFWRVRPLS